MERKKRATKKIATREKELRKELDEFIKELKGPEGLLFMALLDEALPRLREIHETLKALNQDLTEKLARLEKL